MLPSHFPRLLVLLILCCFPPAPAPSSVCAGHETERKLKLDERLSDIKGPLLLRKWLFAKQQEALYGFCISFNLFPSLDAPLMCDWLVWFRYDNEPACVDLLFDQAVDDIDREKFNAKAIADKLNDLKESGDKLKVGGRRQTKRLSMS